MKLNNLLLIVLVTLLPVTTAFSQLEENHLYENSYYLFPIKPGTRNSLAGTMGELRSSHFHTGIDIRTEGRIGLPVMAAANGYVSRIAVSTSGYGNALYILHPNGQTTVYAHLDHFTGPLADYIREQQYEQQTFPINLYFKKGQYKVMKGDTIAYSGNSGSSGGPHLHFDLRDKYQNPLNPLQYGFSEIIDHTPPEAHKLALKTLDINARINGRFGRFEFDVRRVGNDYVIDEPINVQGMIGAELYAYDKLDNSRFKCGINLITMNIDDDEVFRQEINTFSFSEQRNILRHMNYTDLLNSGERYHKLYVDDGNQLRFYSYNDRQGKLYFNGEEEHQVMISMMDSYRNTSHLTLKLKSSANALPPLKTDSKMENSSVDLIDNTLKIQAPLRTDSTVKVYIPEQHEISPAYVVNPSHAVYLWDMRNGVPHSIDLNGENQLLHYKEMVPSNSSYKYYSDKMDIEFPDRSLFDTLYLKTNYVYNKEENLEQFMVGDEHTALRKYISVTLKPELEYNPEKYAVYAIDQYNNYYYKGGNWEYGRVTFSTRDFGEFTILPDTLAPEIVPVTVTDESLRFKIDDDRSGINEVKCYVDGEWVLMKYDYKTKLIWSEKLNPKKPFSGEVKLLVTDNQGNKNIYMTTLSPQS